MQGAICEQGFQCLVTNAYIMVNYNKAFILFHSTLTGIVNKYS